MIAKDTARKGLHAGQGGVAQLNGVDPVRYRHGDRLSRFLRSGEVPVVGPVGKSARPVDQGELEVGLSGVRLPGLAQSPGIGKKFRGGETGLQVAAEGKKGEKNGLRFHDA